MSTSCLGSLGYGNRRFRCWKSGGHGPLSLAGAITESCNVYFYQAGMRLGLDALMEGAARYRFGRPTGIDLPYETPGTFPPSREWYDERYGERGWTESVVLNLSIGQGENQQSLLRMVQFYTALATGKPPIVPHMARSEGLADRRATWELGLSESQRSQLVEALRAAVNHPAGTAYSYRSVRWEIAGKTGTAQNPHGPPHSWFIGFAPVDDPEIVIAAIVEFGHPDYQVSQAVPFAIRVVERYLDMLHPELLAPPALADVPEGPPVGEEEAR
jgi:penicillin-binding protein 2